MKNGLVSALLCASGCVASNVTSLWPMPLSASVGSSLIELDGSFAFTQNQNSDILSRAIDRYTTLIGVPADKSGVLSSCSVNVESVPENEAATLQPGVDESYTLSIDDANNCIISSATTWGALHALETFTQLLERDSSGSVVIRQSPVKIVDDTRFTHRGMLIDSSRHYLPVSEIQRMIDTLPMSKFNVLHWHMVDAQSFPVDTPSAPEIVKGAYAPDLIYSMDDIKMLRDYATDRGVRLLLEIDVPGHAASWNAGYPNTMAQCFEKYYYNINDFALNPAVEETYTVLTAVLSDLIAATSAAYVHIGGDEVVYGCWKEDASITAFMSENNMESYDDLLAYFILRADEIVRSLGATPVHWEEVFEAGVQVLPDTIFEVWTSQSEMKSVAAANFTIISAPSDVWYLE